jgi:hypothetical protein
MDDLCMCHGRPLALSNVLLSIVYCNNVSINEFFLDKQQHRHSSYTFFDVCGYC